MVCVPVSSLRSRRLAVMSTFGKGALRDRFSKTCSAWGAVTTKPALSEREFACEACGLVIDRTGTPH